MTIYYKCNSRLNDEINYFNIIWINFRFQRTWYRMALCTTALYLLIYGIISSRSFDGLWETGVKSIKTHLKKTFASSYLTFEEIKTIFIHWHFSASLLWKRDYLQNLLSLLINSGANEIVRGVTIRISSDQIFRRPISKLQVLPCIVPS